MIYEMNKPSKNMLLSQRELDKMYIEQQNEYFSNNNKEDEILKEQGIYNRAVNEHAMYLNEYANRKYIDTNKRVAFLQKAKESLLTECMMKIYTESLKGMDKRDKMIARNLITRFVQENGAENLIMNFRTKNILLSEVSRICKKYYDKILESCDKKCECGDNNISAEKEYSIAPEIRDNFYSDLEDLNTVDAASEIKQRVGEGLEDFINSNSAAQLEYQDTIKATQEAIDDVNGDKTKDEATKEAYIQEATFEAKRKINQLRRDKPKNVFTLMVEALTTKALVDESYKKQYINESKVNMDKIVEDATLIYTMLEMVNTTEMVYVDEQFIINYLENLRK